MRQSIIDSRVDSRQSRRLDAGEWTVDSKVNRNWYGYPYTAHYTTNYTLTTLESTLYKPQGRQESGQTYLTLASLSSLSSLFIHPLSPSLSLSLSANTTKYYSPAHRLRLSASIRFSPPELRPLFGFFVSLTLTLTLCTLLHSLSYTLVS